jgi:hypothetical protein
MRRSALDEELEVELEVTEDEADLSTVRTEEPASPWMPRLSLKVMPIETLACRFVACGVKLMEMLKGTGVLGSISPT